MDLDLDFKIKSGQLLAIQHNMVLILGCLEKIYGKAGGIALGEHPFMAFQAISVELKLQSHVLMQAIKSVNATCAEIADANNIPPAS